MKEHVLRLDPDSDLRKELTNFTVNHAVKAGLILTCVGSLDKAVIRMAGARDVKMWEGEFEIISLTGTLSPSGPHLHISISDPSGAVFGGHLQDGSIIRTTAEIVAGELEDWEFTRELDPRTGFKELNPIKK